MALPFDERPVPTRRELEIEGLIMLHHTNEEITESMGIALQTVKNHIRGLFDHRGVNSRAQLRVLLEDRGKPNA
jgi:DNA-binding CsgD family transcriptional regulator